MEVLIGHFSTKTAVDSIIQEGIRLPLFLTTDMDLGSTYGSNVALFKVDGDVPMETYGRIGRVGNNHTGTTNKYANGMMELVIETPAQLNNFLDAVIASGSRHCCHIAHIAKKQRELRLEKENKLKVDKPKRRSRLRM